MKNVLVANEKSSKPAPKARKLSPLSFLRNGRPAKTFEAAHTRSEVAVIFFSMLTSLRSKIISGSATRNIDRMKAIRFRPMQSSSVAFELRLNAETRTPRSKPRNQPISVTPS